MDMIFFNGTVLTMDPSRPLAEALAVNGGRIAGVGSAKQLESAATTKTVRMDLGGRTVCPGFIDAHCHFYQSTLDLVGVNCRPERARTIPEIRERLREAAARSPAGTWVRAWGYDEARLIEGRHPTREDLDAAAPRHPVLLLHVSCHQCVVNSAALGVLGIEPATPDPLNGWIGRDRQGRLTGILYETASADAENVCRLSLHHAHTDHLETYAVQHARRLYATGITRICDAGVVPQADSLYAALAASGRFKLRVHGLGLGAGGLFVPPDDRLRAPPENAHFRICGVKYFADGAEQCAICLRPGAVARMFFRGLGRAVRGGSLKALRLTQAARPRLGRDGNFHFGMLFYDSARLHRYLKRTSEIGLGAAIHAIGNEGIRHTIEAAALMRRQGGDQAALRIEHAMMMEPEQAIRAEDALALYTRNAATVLGVQDVCGSLAPGKDADLVVLSANPLDTAPEKLGTIQVLRTYIGGECVHEKPPSGRIDDREASTR